MSRESELQIPRLLVSAEAGAGVLSREAQKTSALSRGFSSAGRKLLRAFTRNTGRKDHCTSAEAMQSRIEAENPDAHLGI
ncbi:MAG: hypothetical protein GC137_06740 [Alphaproteobacteria bacterium]|nr:hypothetical protein [Alphaproteobacteria bacterium]